jgi:hypothetical protein
LFIVFKKTTGSLKKSQHTGQKRFIRLREMEDLEIIPLPDLIEVKRN